MNTAEVIRNKRRELGLSQTWLARLVSIEIGYSRESDYFTQSACSRWEAPGQLGRPLTSEVLPAMAVVLGLDVLELLGGDPALAQCPIAALASHVDVLVGWVTEHGTLTLVDPLGDPLVKLTQDGL